MRTQTMWGQVSRGFGILILMLCLLLGGQAAIAAPMLPPHDSAVVLSEPPTPEAGGGGAWNTATDSGISDALWNEIMLRARANEARLEAEGKLIATNPDAVIKFSQPVRANNNQVKPVYYALTNFFNHGTGGALVDFKNKSRTLPVHYGTDYLPYPFPWNMMDNSDVAVVAAADGLIVDKVDDEEDRRCGTDPSYKPNYILLRHNAFTYTIYLHMKAKSLTTKTVDQYVTRGEFLGLVGSSGQSTAPHLHFEWRIERYTNSYDPFKGPGNPIAESRWVTQEKYYVSRILDLATSGQAVTMPDCAPGTLVPQTVFARGDTVRFAAFFRDVRPSHLVEYQILRPDGSLSHKWNPPPHPNDLPSAWWWTPYSISANAPLGTWKFRVLLGGQTTEKNFQVCNGAPARPTLEQPQNGAFVSDSTVKFKWNAPACADNYIIEVNASTKTGPNVLWDSGIRATSYKGFISGATSYWWRIQACNKFGCTSSRWWNFTTP